MCMKATPDEICFIMSQTFAGTVRKGIDSIDSTLYSGGNVVVVTHSAGAYMYVRKLKLQRSISRKTRSANDFP
jgi:hypothetical protein